LYRCVAKGAAEVMQSMFTSVPSNYTELNEYYARQGCRVLALGYKILELRDIPEHRNQIRTMKREEMESDLIFAGFLILSCPLKRDSKQSIQHLLKSSHRCVMITGDHVLTACSVATEVGICEQNILILTHRNKQDDVVWQSVDNKTTIPFDLTMVNKQILTYSHINILTT
jgi:cation-transporting ATPase 13A1